MNKILKVIALIMIVCMLGGCGGPEVLDEDFEIIGTYMGVLLDKYNTGGDIKDYSLPIDYPDDTNTSTNTTTDTVTVTKTEDGSEDVEDAIKDAEKVDKIEEQSIEFGYKKMLIGDIYPETSDMPFYVYVEAIPGTKLLTLEFEIKNNTDKSRELKDITFDMKYKLLVNDEYLYAPIMTALGEDILSEKIVVEPNATQKGVLVFQTASAVATDINKMLLIITKAEDKSFLVIK